MILVFHKICNENPPTRGWITLETFKKQISNLLYAEKYSVYLDEYIPFTKYISITFDGVYENILPAAQWLQSHRIPFECFVIGATIGKDNQFDVLEPYARFADRAMLQQLVELGGRLQWHSVTHSLVLSRKSIKFELDWEKFFPAYRSPHFRWYAYPHGKIYIPDEVRKAFKGAVVYENGNDDDRYLLCRNIMREKTCLS